ncbi:tRNA1(Val) (adenine(37)-N6)-methyltransferase [Rubrolithibacter danxiaensis]|uniref:tRNA1(Val) (adenine(37)-N6)-methyltransferase n=1 Tax=Rubrolithibacter danxiaensis TaxID=3390805 RepID=UPI003BF87AB0
MFHFKQFSIDQTGCAMKINTDGVLLGALAESENPMSILDIGTGTGVIALMLAQRFLQATVEAVEIDKSAAERAALNFSDSPFADRLKVCNMSFQDFFLNYPDKQFDMIVSNPPFFINSLKNPDSRKNLARHTMPEFFASLVSLCYKHLSRNGICWFILPVHVADLVNKYAKETGLEMTTTIRIKSFENSEPHRYLIAYKKNSDALSSSDFIIYQSEKVYSEEYKAALSPFFTIF